MSSSVTMVVKHHAGGSAGSTFSPRFLSGPVAWLPWSQTNPITTHARERDFVATLAAISDETPREHTRSDVTALLNALRGGLSVDALLYACPGIAPARLLGAYGTLEALRRDAVAAWSDLVAEPTVASLQHVGERAASLVPSLVNRLREAAMVDPGVLPRVAALLAADVEAVRRAIRNAELELDRTTDAATAIAISRTLYDPTTESLFDRASHLPERVGSLVPSRVAALLGERGHESPSRSAL